MFSSIRWRIAIPFTLLISLLMIIVAIYITQSIRQYFIRDLKNHLLTEAQIVQNALGKNFTSGLMQGFDFQAKQWASLTNSRVTIINADGIVLGDSQEDFNQMSNQANRVEIIGAAQTGQGFNIQSSNLDQQDVMYIAIPVLYDDQLFGFIRLSSSMEQLENKILQLQSAILIFTILSSIIAFILATWIASRTTQPLRQLTLAAGRISSGDLESRITLSTVDEVSKLTKAFNSMADELRAQISALESERGKLSAVLNEMSDGVLIVDDSGKIQLINPAAEQMFGVNQADTMGRSLIEAFRQHQIFDLWQKSQQSDDLQVIMVELLPQRLYLQSVGTKLGKALPGSTLLLFQNLTRVRHLETVRQDFISNISHELRTPLAALKALTETLQESALDDPEAARRFLQRMETEVDSLSLMVSELLELSRIESGKVPLKLEAVLPWSLINQSVERLALQAERSGLTIEIDCREDIKPVLADPTRLEQVLVNLLHNAIKFTPRGGTITIGCIEQQNKAKFWVNDTGIGIPKEDLSRIFERFYKTDRARSGGGTGLGLAIARHLVEAHGGKIWATSTEGQGSNFAFTIPFET